MAGKYKQLWTEKEEVVCCAVKGSWAALGSSFSSILFPYLRNLSARVLNQ